MKKITDKDVERLKAGKKITKGFIHMQLDDKGRLNLWSDINITDNYKGFMDARGRLFFCFSDIVRHLKKETKGKILFLGENVRMRDEHRWVITEELGVEPVEIDSALVSAQTRHRLYWCNWPVEMPKDKHISLDDILEHDHRKGTRIGGMTYAILYLEVL